MFIFHKNRVHDNTKNKPETSPEESKKPLAKESIPHLLEVIGQPEIITVRTTPAPEVTEPPTLQSPACIQPDSVDGVRIDELATKNRRDCCPAELKDLTDETDALVVAGEQTSLFGDLSLAPKTWRLRFFELPLLEMESTAVDVIQKGSLGRRAMLKTKNESLGKSLVFIGLLGLLVVC